MPATTPLTHERDEAFADEAVEIGPQLRELRRELHRNAEIGLHLPLTQRLVLDALAGLDLEITTGKELSSVTAVLRGGRPGPTVLLRGDMDALPVNENNDLAYRSETDAMHACGHDLHTAGLVGAAKLLAAQRDNIAGSVIFMFQPGEEGYNGASVMLREGILDAAGDQPVAAYAIHVGTGERGMFMTRPGSILAGSATLRVVLHGTGGHGSTPSRANDPVPAVAEAVLALQNVVTRRVNVLDPAVLTITQLWAGDAANVIPGRAGFSGTLRAFSAETFELLDSSMNRLVNGIAEAHGLRAEYELERGYAALSNHEELTQQAKELIQRAFGEDRHLEVPTPNMGSEDFSFVAQQVPSCYVFLGSRPDHIEAGSTYPHSPDVEFDDEVLPDQARLLALLAWQHVGVR